MQNSCLHFGTVVRARKRKRKKRHVETRVHPGMFGNLRQCLAALFHLPSIVLHPALIRLWCFLICFTRYVHFWFPQILRQSPALGGLRRTLPRGFCISRLLALKKRHVRQPQNIGFKLQPSAFLFWWLQHVATFRFGLTSVTSVVLLNIPFSSIFLLM